MKRFILWDDHFRHNCVDYLMELELTKAKEVVIKDYEPKRSLDQNAFLHAVPLKIISSETGHSINEMKEYLLGEAFGWESVTIGEKTFERPLRRSSELNRKEFTWFIDWIQAWASNTLNLRIPNPNEVEE